MTEPTEARPGYPEGGGGDVASGQHGPGEARYAEQQGGEAPPEYVEMDETEVGRGADDATADAPPDDTRG